MSNTQHRLDKARPPRVQITYDVEIGGAENKKELPLVIGVIGNFATDDNALRDRHFLHVDKDNFNSIMEGMGPTISLLVDSALPEKEGKLPVELSFNTIDDFCPESIAMQVEPLRQLIELREQLSDLRNRTASNDRLKDELAKLLTEHKNSITTDTDAESE